MGSGELMQPMLPLVTAQPDCSLAGADTYMPGVVCARQQFWKQRHGPKVAGALWMYGPDHVCSKSWRRIKPNRMTPAGSDPTPFRNDASSHRLRPLGQVLLAKSDSSTFLIGGSVPSSLDHSSTTPGPGPCHCVGIWTRRQRTSCCSKPCAQPSH